MGHCERRAMQGWTHRDLLFVARTLVPERSDREHVARLLREDDSLRDGMLADDRLYQDLMSNDEVLVSVSPQFFFAVLLLRTHRDLEQELYTVERRHQQKVVLFDAQHVVELLGDANVRDYLAGLLASFTRINSRTISYRVHQGIWRRLRVNDLDVESLIRYAQVLDEDQRFRVYQRIADACLFLSGIFPEYIETRQRYPGSGQPQLTLRGSLLQSLEDYERYGQRFYGLASRHRMAATQGLDGVLVRLSEQFILAEKPLAFLAERYLALRKHRLFEVK